MRSTNRLHMAHTPSKKMMGCSSGLVGEAPAVVATVVCCARLVTTSRCQIRATRATITPEQRAHPRDTAGVDAAHHALCLLLLHAVGLEGSPPLDAARVRSLVDHLSRCSERHSSAPSLCPSRAQLDRGADCAASSPRTARSAAVWKYSAKTRGASGTPLNPGMLHMSTTYGVPSLSMMSTPYRSMPNARPQRRATSRSSGVSAKGSPCFSASVRQGKTFLTPNSRPPIA